MCRVDTENGESTNETKNDTKFPDNDLNDEEDLEGKHGNIIYLDTKSVNIQNNDKNDHIQVLESDNNGQLTNADILYDTFIA